MTENFTLGSGDLPGGDTEVTWNTLIWMFKLLGSNLQHQEIVDLMHKARDPIPEVAGKAVFELKNSLPPASPLGFGMLAIATDTIIEIQASRPDDPWNLDAQMRFRSMSAGLTSDSDQVLTE